jgi:hypothetical protein
MAAGFTQAVIHKSTKEKAAMQRKSDLCAEKTNEKGSPGGYSAHGGYMILKESLIISLKPAL